MNGMILFPTPLSKLVPSLSAALILSFALPAAAQGPPVLDDRPQRINPERAREIRLDRERRAGGGDGENGEETRTPSKPAPPGQRSDRQAEELRKKVSPSQLNVPQERLREQVRERAQGGVTADGQRLSREEMMAVRRAVQARRVQMQQERATHMQRMAQLARIREIAQEQNNAALLKRVAVLEDKEKRRHDRRLERLHRDTFVDPATAPVDSETTED